MVSAAHIDVITTARAGRLAVRRNASEPALWDLLDDVVDPEVPVLSLWELGVLQDVRREGDDVVVVTTPTYAGCPAMDDMERALRERLAAAGHGRVRVVRRLSPAWTTDWLSADARRKLVEYGIAAPHAFVCPQCASARVSRIAEFGSTACKALYRCDDCGEPFDVFKPL
jgi:ring-1,2-phenylacetyl-CoA epoxidase subunit PaaD